MKISKKLLGIFLAALMVVSFIGSSSAQAADKTFSEIKAEMGALYGENKRITDGNYDKSLAVKCVNGTYVGKKNDGVIARSEERRVGK